MARTKVIKNIEDLAEAWGAHEPTEESIKRAVYKNTDCGAYIGFGRVGVDQRRVRFQVACNDSILGPVCIGWRKGGRGPWRCFNEVGTPQELVAFFGTYPEPTFCGPHKELLKLPEDLGSAMAQVKENAGDVTWQRPSTARRFVCWAEIEVTTSGPGITLGSIVEGSDEGTESFELAYPFTTEQLDKVVQEIEGQATVLWDIANNVPACEVCGESVDFDTDTDGSRIYSTLCKDCKVLA